MRTLYENDCGEILGCETKDGIVQFYFIDANGKKTATKRMSVDYLIGGTF